MGQPSFSPTDLDDFIHSGPAAAVTTTTAATTAAGPSDQQLQEGPGGHWLEESSASTSEDSDEEVGSVALNPDATDSSASNDIYNDFLDLYTAVMMP